MYNLTVRAKEDDAVVIELKSDQRPLVRNATLLFEENGYVAVCTKEAAPKIVKFK